MISVIIPVYNDYSRLCSLVAQVDKLGFGEILICDNGSTDKLQDVDALLIDTPHYIIRCPAVKSSYYARNVGIKRAKGTSLLFLDSDVVLHDSFTMEVVKKYLDFPIVVSSVSWFYTGRFPKLFNGFFTFLEGCNPITACVLIRKEVFSESLFDDRFTSGSDTRFIEPRGYVGTTEMKVLHPVTAKGYFYRQIRYASSSEYSKNPAAALIKFIGTLLSELPLIIFEFLAALFLVKFKQGWQAFLFSNTIHSVTRVLIRFGTLLTSLGVRIR